MHGGFPAFHGQFEDDQVPYVMIPCRMEFTTRTHTGLNLGSWLVYLGLFVTRGGTTCAGGIQSYMRPYGLGRQQAPLHPC
jgi:hypothetical protein